MTLPKTYRKLVATKFTRNFREAAQVVEEELRPPAAKEVVIRNRFAGVNASDINITSGKYFYTKEPPIDLGIESAGEVVSVGKDVTQFKVGDSVLTFVIGGGYREYLITDESNVYPVPQIQPEMLALICSGLPASIGLNVTGQLKSGETVLVTAAAGGTGQFAVQLAKLAGAHVIGTCGSEEKVELLRELGCDRVINYRREDVKDVLQKEYPKGIQLVYENVGGQLFDTCVDALAQHGRLIVIGYVSEYQTDAQPVTAPRIYQKLLWKSLSIRACFIPDHFEIWRPHLALLVELLQTGKIKAKIDPTELIGLESVAAGVEHLHSGRSRGKVVVRL